MRCQQTACGGEYRPLAVALDGATFEHKVEAVHVFTLYSSVVVEPAVQGIVKLCREFLAPAVEPEVEQAAVAVVISQRDETMVAGPSIV